VHLRGGSHATPPYIHNAHAVSGRLPPAHLISASPGRGTCHAAPGRLQVHLVSAARVGVLPHLHSTKTPNPAPVVNLPAHPVGASPGRGLCHASLHRHNHAGFGRLFPVHPVGASLKRGPLPYLLTSERLRRLRSSHTGAPRWSISRKGACHASLYQHAYASYRHLLTGPPSWCISRMPRFFTLAL